VFQATEEKMKYLWNGIWKKELNEKDFCIIVYSESLINSQEKHILRAITMKNRLYSIVIYMMLLLVLVTPVHAVSQGIIKLYIYDDGVVVEGNITIPNTSNQTGVLRALINATETGTRIVLYFNGTAVTNSTQRIEDVELFLSASTAKEDKLIITVLNGYLTYSSNETGFLRADYNATYILDQKQYNATIKGEARLQASGAVAAIFLYLGFLNKDLIENYLETYGIKGVKINDLMTTVSGNKAKIKFNVGLDLNQLFNSTNLTGIPGVKTSYPNLTFVPGKTDLRLSVHNNQVIVNLTVTTDSDINILLENMATILANMEFLLPQQNNQLETRKAVDALVNFTKEFQVKTSEGYLIVITDPNTVEIKFKTLKIISKNGDLNQTLEDLAALIEQTIGIKEIGETKVEIHPQENIKVTINNETPATISLSQLGSLTVTITETTTAQESTTTSTINNLANIGIGATIIIILLILITAFSKKQHVSQPYKTSTSS